ncbi:hypothetical protein CRP01_30095 [Flavilitoribacter nigricans DSM 23189 = NBRC 102662]|uniref:Uncharacterized protein n=1 Tax=Flavilitoribacter nigricans (strain ATCC 23147 / DSM 23189 / NBRC 102662 / NCIMB 1420 / SS-2) TaxID=1122177 RepID=A0A2D0N2V1_FLAN2|nr:hypothetical protein CRP01_30095 [Flavilitoribacter nigricans DSM 23189 = NBRC 102662]
MTNKKGQYWISNAALFAFNQLIIKYLKNNQDPAYIQKSDGMGGAPTPYPMKMGFCPPGMRCIFVV